MTDSLLRSLREHMLDESEPLAGLLRKCLLLGAETGSDALRQWSRRELNGYGGDDEVPEYRELSGVISMDSISGNTWAKGQIITRYQLPQEAWEYVPDKFALKQPIEELERLALQKSLSFTSPGLAYAQTIWNKQLGPFQSIMGLSYVMSGSVIAGVLGQIRTHLVDLIADLTADTPLSELPRKDQVDAAVGQYLSQPHAVYNTTINEASGPVAVGTGAEATTEGISVADAIRLLDNLRAEAAEISGVHQEEMLAAIADLREALGRERPETGEVVKKVGMLRKIAGKVGVASISAATGGLAQALTELAVDGAFG